MRLYYETVLYGRLVRVPVHTAVAGFGIVYMGTFCIGNLEGKMWDRFEYLDVNNLLTNRQNY